MVQKGLLNFSLWQITSRRNDHVSQSVKASCRCRRKYFFASRGEQIIGGYPKKPITFLNIPFIATALVS